MIVIPQDVIVARPTGALNALMRAQVEIEFGRVGDASIDRRARRNVARLSRLFFLIGTKQAKEKKLTSYFKS